MITWNDKNYELKITIQRYKMIENVLKKPIIEIAQKGYMTLNEVIICCGYALVPEATYAHVQPKEGMEIMEKVIESQEGAYLQLTNEFADAIQRDCPFLFPKD